MTPAEYGFLRRAIALAEANVVERRGGPFGAVVVRAGTILGEGTNTVPTACDPTAHGEIAAIRAACAATGQFALDGAVLYASCEPCPMCLAAAYWARLDRVVYAADRAAATLAGFDDAELYAELARPPAERRLPCHQALAEEGGKPLAAWQADRHAVAY